MTILLHLPWFFFFFNWIYNFQTLTHQMISRSDLLFILSNLFTLLSALVQLHASHQFVYHSAPVWFHYQEVLVNTVCVPPPQPPPSQQVYGYYILPQQSPQFMLPHASLHPWGATKGTEKVDCVISPLRTEPLKPSWIKLNLGQMFCFYFSF